MRVLALDLGQRRIGLAVSEPDGDIALPVGTLERCGEAADLQELGRLAKQRAIDRIVVGLPIHMNGRVGPEAEAARRFARRLGTATGLPVDTLDERWTTLEAERALRSTGRPGRKRRQVIDSVAAAILLRTYLARLSAAEDEERGE